MGYDFNFSLLLPYAGDLLKGLVFTAGLSALTVLLSFSIAVVGAAMRIAPSPVARLVARLYVDFFRNSPLLVVLYVVYFGIGASMGISAFATGLIALTLVSTAYTIEIYRGGILAVPVGQWEAASALGFSTQQKWRRVILPQAIPRAFYPLGNQVVGIVLGSSLVMVVSAPDLMFHVLNAGATTFRYVEAFIVAAVLYILVVQLLNRTWSLVGRTLFPAYRA